MGVPASLPELSEWTLRTKSPVPWILAGKLYVNFLSLTNPRYIELLLLRTKFPPSNELLREMIGIV